ncbi:uncharacterized protein BJ212DRAFT_1583818 [Suillus subaureus]|uniref:DUF5575 domain-containing protein n=1 Tax=Suillus subaureus TaxID=48587 RepID=A0A9P7EQ41_9AGAM|nr:uncharacterized protein BJ212DRAFT_1583818 [Suillus subaureus]KAG1827281.1 hypothetical protein BJ212DRAFT_1583818 [Suillus subaureus]
MATPTVSTFVSSVILVPIVVAVSSAAISSLLSYEIAGQLDWRPITVCVTCDILAIGVDHLKDQEVVIGAWGAAVMKRFAPVFHLARIFLAFNASLLVIALCRSPPGTTLVTAVFAAPAFLWATPLDLRRIGVVLKSFIWANYDQKETEYDPPRSNEPFIIKRVPGMKAIFDGIIRGCGTFFVVHSALQLSWETANNAPPWTIIEIIIWSTVNRTCHCIMSDIRDYDEDEKAGVPTIPILLESPLKTRIVLTIVQAAVMMAFLRNPFIVGSSCFAIALVWILGKDSPKIYFRLSLHSQSIFIAMYAVMFALDLL